MSATDIVRCPTCSARNRLRAGDPGSLPTCGRCGSDLPWLVQADDASFDRAVAARVPVLVDFWAEWCGPCRMVAPVVEELAQERAGALKVLKLDVDANATTAARFGVRSIPTLMLFKDGRAVETIVGALPKAALIARLDPHLRP